MIEETIYVVVGCDGCDLHVERAFDNPEKAIEYAEECSLRSNDGHNRREYGFSVLKRVLMRWSND